MLQKHELVLLIYLRDPTVQKMSNIEQLFQYFCKPFGSNAANIAVTCSEYFLGNNGKTLTFLFDGYDELPKEVKDNSLIADILNCQVLPDCGLVVSSHPMLLCVYVNRLHCELTSWDLLKNNVNTTLNTHSTINHKSNNSPHTLSSTLSSVACVMFLLISFSYSSSTSRELLYPTMLPNFTISLFALPYVDTSANMELLLNNQSQISTISPSLMESLYNRCQRSPYKH